MKRVIGIIMSIAMFLTISAITFTNAGLIPEAEPVMPGGDKTENMVNQILGMLSAIGYAVAAGMLIYVGIKYVMSAANEKAELKNASMKYAFGAVILFSASTVFKIVESLMSQIEGEG